MPTRIGLQLCWVLAGVFVVAIGVLTVGKVVGLVAQRPNPNMTGAAVMLAHLVEGKVDKAAHEPRCEQGDEVVGEDTERDER